MYNVKYYDLVQVAFLAPGNTALEKIDKQIPVHRGVCARFAGLASCAAQRSKII